MQVNILTIYIVALASIVQSAQLPSLFARQSTCSVSSGCNCYVGQISSPSFGDEPLAINTCDGQKCDSDQSPLVGAIPSPIGDIAYSLAQGACI
ncbi:hypothetical protein QCA50_013172 [Cerrena zonata]|uniref:Uncharacterized protein n=1 Tax=Cerrena zonata TaxID=2478898 RepID=A0AAW0FSM6_9APHY